LTAFPFGHLVSDTSGSLGEIDRLTPTLAETIHRSRRIMVWQTRVAMAVPVCHSLGDAFTMVGTGQCAHFQIHLALRAKPIISRRKSASALFPSRL